MTDIKGNISHYEGFLKSVAQNEKKKLKMMKS